MLTHVALTVSDLGRSVPWYQALIGSDPVIDEDTGPFRHVVWMLGNQTLLGIHQHANPSSAESFDELRPGLDHVAFGCASRGELETWAARLDELGCRARGNRGCPLRFRPFLPRPRQQRSRVLRSTGLTAAIAR